jgi:hypothetical protein
MQGFMARYEKAWQDPHNAPELKQFWTDDAEVYVGGDMDNPVRGAKAAAAMVDVFLKVAPDISMVPMAAAENPEEDLLFIQFTCAGTFKGQHVKWVAVDRFEFPPEGDQAKRGYSFFSPPEAVAAFE